MKHDKIDRRRRRERGSAFFDIFTECICWLPEVVFGIGRLLLWLLECIGRLCRGVFDLS